MNSVDHFNFDNLTERRNSGSYKWDLKSMQGLLPMWVADMDFQSAPCIQKALLDKVSHNIYGYSIAPPSLEENVVLRLKKKYQWTIKKDWIVWLPGLETSFALASDSIGKEGDQVICFPPIYPPFKTGPRFAKRQVIPVEMDFQNYRWSLDFEKLENCIKENPRVKLLLFCNPHNPIGKVYTKEELQQLLDLCLKYKLCICSDEVHCDLILNKKEHIPIASLLPELEQNSITLMAASKTFNIAGLGCGFAIIPNEKLRQSFKLSMRGYTPMINPFAFAATEAAFSEGEPWRRQLIEYLKRNVNYLNKEFQSISNCSFSPPEASFLAWIDCRKTQLDDPCNHFRSHGLGLSPGHHFGSPGWVRLNFACPKSTLEEGMRRFKKALT